jgi:C-methyltransferase
MTQTSPPSSVLELLIGKWVAQAVSAAAELRIADELKDGPRPCAEVARAVGASEDALYRLLRALAAVQVVEELDGRRFALTDLGAQLRSDVPLSFAGYARLCGHDITWRPWGRLAESVRTARPAFEAVFGAAGFDYIATHPDAAAAFNDGMTAITSAETMAIVAAYDFGAFRTLVDVGGGHGLLLASALRATPGLRGILFDLPAGVDPTRALFRAEGVAERVEVVTASFFDGVPEGGDAYMMKHILHDWDDARALQILRNCRRALPAGGRLLTIEIVIGTANAGTLGSFLDLEMLVMTSGGRERTAEEYRALYEASGFRLERVVETMAPASVIEGVAV